MLHDRARIHVSAGDGGDGAVSFRREAHVPRGGPDGGNGGRGGAVVVVCDDSLRDLQAFRRRSSYRAAAGGRGEGALRHGARGEDLILRVPAGTLIEAAGLEGDPLARRSWELLAPGQRATVARGGAGGRGNKQFATATRQAPRFAERGLPGEEALLELRLKLLADVGLVGMPNAGKSSLLARLTRAAPKVADYPFTTLSPVLGVLEGEERALVVADIPGLIEGASEGAGLGDDFLAHVERTRLLVHVLDMAPELWAGEGEDPLRNHATIERELAAHDARLAALPRVLALSKVDLVGEDRARGAVAEWTARLGGEASVIATSSATGAGIAELAGELLRLVGPREDAAARAGAGERPALLADEREREDDEQLPEHVLLRPAGRAGYHVERLGPRTFAVSGYGIERLLARHDPENPEALAYLEERLRRIGVLSALRAEGYQPGDEVKIGGATLMLGAGK
jgi:GTP-binding protein